MEILPPLKSEVIIEIPVFEVVFNKKITRFTVDYKLVIAVTMIMVLNAKTEPTYRQFTYL